MEEKIIRFAYDPGEYFRVSGEQYDFLIRPWKEAQEKARRTLKEVVYTYEEFAEIAAD